MYIYIYTKKSSYVRFDDFNPLAILLTDIVILSPEVSRRCIISSFLR